MSNANHCFRYKIRHDVWAACKMIFASHVAICATQMGDVNELCMLG